MLIMNLRTLLIVILTNSNLLFSQELPEIPMKNGMAYYVFEHKLDNKSNCLSKYFGYESNSTMFGKSFSVYKTKLNDKVVKDKFGFNLSFMPKSNIKCLDTLSGGANLLTFGKAGNDILWKPIIIELFSKRVMKSVVSANFSIVFTSKTDYKMIIKDVTYTIDYIKGGKHGVDYYKVGELYEQTKASDKITKSDIKFFENLNFFMQSADEIILKSLTDAYQADEL